VNRRTATELIIVGGTGLLTGCAPQSVVAPNSSRLEPLSQVVGVLAGKNIVAPPAYHGYANAAENLIQAIRDAGLDPQLILAGILGRGTFSLGPSAFGWMFAIQNVVFGTDAAGMTLGADQLWAAYRKLSLG
jgi:hypothetical protein